VTPAVQRDLVQEMRFSYQVGVQRACRVLGFNRSTVLYRSVADPQAALRIRLKDLAASRVGWGYRRLLVLLL